MDHARIGRSSVLVKTKDKGLRPQMPPELQRLIDASRVREFPAEEREAQRRSFAYGNTNIENPRITRNTVDREAEALKREAARTAH
jgi:hypothetical protein